MMIQDGVIKLLFIYGAFILAFGCKAQHSDIADPEFRVNTAHLDHLYQEIALEGSDTVGVVNIYAEYPDYHYVDDDDEGFACIDDAARAAVFYLRHWDNERNPESLRKAEMLLKFLVAMQSDNGYFYNFVWPDNTIHREGPTTINDPQWWSWRVLWAIAEAEYVADDLDTELVNMLISSRSKLIDAMLAEALPFDSVKTVEGLDIPQWLPAGSATDQAALIVLGLHTEYMRDPTSESSQYLIKMADGILRMQVRDSESDAEGAFLSWQNVWHAYASSQSYALLLAYEITGEQVYRDAALYEINTFYPKLLGLGQVHSFRLMHEDGRHTLEQIRKYEQIAYGIRPMVWACLKAYEVTGDGNYLEMTKEFMNWFSGANIASFNMYDPETGRGYDGIIEGGKVNMNSGAESTIEALLSVQEYLRVKERLNK